MRKILNKLKENENLRFYFEDTANDWLKGTLSERLSVFFITVMKLLVLFSVVFSMYLLIKINMFIPLVGIICAICIGLTIYSKLILKIFSK